MRISILLPGGFGAFGNVARNIAKGVPEFRFDLLYLNGPAPDDMPDVPGNARMTRLDRRSRSCWIPLARHLRATRPDTLISLGWYLHPAAALAVLAARTSTPLVLNEASSLSYKAWVEHRDEPALRVLGRLAPVVYPRAAVVTCVSTAVLDDLVRTVGVSPERVALRVVPNAIDAVGIGKRSLLPDSGALHTADAPVFVAVARHVRQKNLPLLLRAFRRYLDGEGAGSLVLVGGGPDTPALHALTRDLGLVDRVTFRGGLINPYPQIASATALVQSSEEEGFGLALVEAMALGVPVIATDCPGGPREILDDGRCGLLVGQDEEELAAAMLRVASDTELRRACVDAGRTRARDFTPERVGDTWREILATVTTPRGARA